MSSPLELTPGHALGPFQLGTMLFNVLNHVRTYRAAYPHAKVAWDEKDPSTGPLHLTLLQPPLHLVFSPLTQRLTRLEVVGMSPGSWVSYRGRVLQNEGDEGEEDAVKLVRRAFGPTYGSSRVENRAGGVGGEKGGREEEMLSYPGVAFGVVSSSAETTLSRIILTPLPSPAEVPVDRAWLYPVLPASPAAAAGDLRLAEIFLDSSNRPTRTLLLFYPSSTSSSDVEDPSPFELLIGQTTSEDILCELGGAIRTFWKEDERLSIHTAGIDGGVGALSPNPYFLSYPHLGLTLLLTSSPTPPSLPSPSTSSSLIPPHTLLKIVLHSNLPGKVNFGRTARAVWAFFREGEGESEGEGGRGGGRLVGVEDGAEAVRKALRLRTAKSGGGTSPSPPGSGISSNGSSASGGGGKKKKGGNGGAGGQGSGKVENLLGLSTFGVHSSSSSPSSSSPSPLSAGGKKGGEEKDTEGEDGEGERPMILDRTADGSVAGNDGGKGGGLRGKTTEIHGFPGVALEVTQEGEVETVWLF
ncbi:hypothetical protein JCM8547_003703 [Rhodosporidiobolus lusitaniae]